MPCRIYRGTTAYQGTATRIEIGSVVLVLPAEVGQSLPDVGERVQVELSLPTDEATDRCLTASAKVRQVTLLPDGSSETLLQFGKAHFADRGSVEARLLAKAATPAWEM